MFWHWNPGARLVKKPPNWLPVTSPTFSIDVLWFSQVENDGRTCADAVKDVSRKMPKATKACEASLVISHLLRVERDGKVSAKVVLYNNNNLWLISVFHIGRPDTAPKRKVS